MRQSKEKKEINSATLKTMFVSLIMGLFFLMGFAIGDDMTTKLTIFFSMFIFMLAATLITDFTSVLIDTRDNLIILPKPVSDATFVTSRLMHIAIHINKLLLPLALPALIALIVLYGPATIVPFILMTFFATLLSIFLVNAVYLLILQLVKPSKLAERFYDNDFKRYKRKGFADVIYTNEKGEITEAHSSNIFAEINGVFYTPPVSCGLLPGTFREYLLKKNPSLYKERVLYPKDLKNADNLYLVNSVRGFVKAALV